MYVSHIHDCLHTYVHLGGQEQSSLLCANMRLIVYLQSSVVQHNLLKMHNEIRRCGSIVAKN